MRRKSSTCELESFFMIVQTNLFVVVTPLRQAVVCCSGSGRYSPEDFIPPFASLRDGTTNPPKQLACRLGISPLKFFDFSADFL